MELRTTAKRGPKPKPDTHNNLLQAGLQMIHAEGYSASGIQGIVERADVPKGSFYTYFASKEAFGTEVINLYSERSQVKLRDFLCNRETAPLARLEAYFDDRIAAFRSFNYTRGCLLGNFSAEAADHSTTIRDFLPGISGPGAPSSSPACWRRAIRERSAVNFPQHYWPISFSTAGREHSFACAPKKATHLSSHSSR